ncbi:dimethylarginine dimethylaminohydrolase family protein [Bacillaceae bacterium S4-13-58]
MSETPEHSTYCHSEFDTLKQVILCEPRYMSIREVINEAQKKYKDEGIDVEKAMKQHHDFVDKLRSFNVDVTLLLPHKKFPEQVFTRDIGFTLGQTIFVAEMKSDVRRGEENVLKSWLEAEEISYYNIVGEEIEGGDVVIDRDTVYVGLSDRTNQIAINHLKGLLSKYEVITVPFEKKYLHLDCVFNVLSPDLALLYPGVIEKEQEELIRSRYEVIEINKEEQFTLGTNILSIGNKRVFSLPQNKHVNKELTKRGFDIIEVDISEIIKSGGSFRCCTMPMKRERSK